MLWGGGGGVRLTILTFWDMSWFAENILHVYPEVGRGFSYSSCVQQPTVEIVVLQRRNCDCDPRVGGSLERVLGVKQFPDLKFQCFKMCMPSLKTQTFSLAHPGSKVEI